MKNLRVCLVTIAILGIGLVWVSASVVGAADTGKRSIPTPHEVHAFEQVLYIPNDAWSCHLELGCVVCKNTSDNPAIAEVTALYKRDDYNIRVPPNPDRAVEGVREHCVNPGQEIWACLSGYVIEPEPGLRPTPDGMRDPAGCPR
jgi:hypothetical protein